MPIIMHTGANIESVSAGPKDLVRLIPGSNKVDDDVWGRIMDAAKTEAKNAKSKTKGGVLYLLENKVIMEVAEDETGIAGITNMNASDAIDVVSNEIDLDNLNKMLAAENSAKGRAGVVKAINKQIETVEQAIAAEG